MQKTFQANAQNTQKEWFIIDATDVPVGRLATEVATILKGKHKPTYTTHFDSGDYVIIINASNLKFTGKKFDDKKYYRHTGHPGGLKVRTAKEQYAIDPTEIIKHAVKGMMPKNALGRKQMKKLFVYTDANHNHAAQNPKAFK